MENLSAALRTWRVKYNLKQEALADKLGISRPQYSKIETGSKPLTVDLLIDLAETFKISPQKLLNELLSYDGDPSSYLKTKAIEQAKTVPYVKSEEGELEFYKKLADYNEKKYLQMYRKFMENCN